MFFENYTPEAGCNDILASFVASKYLAAKHDTGQINPSKAINALLSTDLESLVTTLHFLDEYEAGLAEKPEGIPTFKETIVKKLTPQIIHDARELKHKVENFQFSDLIPLNTNETKLEIGMRNWQYKKQELAEILLQYVDDRTPPELFDNIHPYCNYLAKGRLSDEVTQACKDGIDVELDHVKLPHVLTKHMTEELNSSSMSFEYDASVQTPVTVSMAAKEATIPSTPQTPLKQEDFFKPEDVNNKPTTAAKDPEIPEIDDINALFNRQAPPKAPSESPNDYDSYLQEMFDDPPPMPPPSDVENFTSTEVKNEKSKDTPPRTK